MNPPQKVIRYYYRAKQVVFENGFFNESHQQERVSLDMLTKTSFFREYAWVVLSSGLSEKVVKIIFPKLSVIFDCWQKPEVITENRDRIFEHAMRVFGNSSKINSLLSMANYLCGKSEQEIQGNLERYGLRYLESFKFMGPATTHHFAKNIGLDVAKPDRHLVRIANHFGYNCVTRFCQHLSAFSGDKISVVDIILWRYATLTKNYL